MREAIHVAVVCIQSAPFGLVGLINSTAVHTTARLHFHILTAPELKGHLAAKLDRLTWSRRDLLTSVSSPHANQLSKWRLKLASLGVATDVFSLSLLWAVQAVPPSVTRALLLSDDTIVLTDVRELYTVPLKGHSCAVIEDCSTLFEGVFNYRHPHFEAKHSRSSCSFDTGTLLVDVRAWKQEDVPSRFLDLLGTQRRTEGLYQQINASSTIVAPALLALDKRALKLPSRWLARGLARERFTYSELSYWERLWGQLGVRVPLVTRPFRAVHATAQPIRSGRDALMLRFSGGPIAPWLHPCPGFASAPSGSLAAATSSPLCGWGQSIECARLWRPYVALSLSPSLEATQEGASGKVLRGSTHRQCLPKDPSFSSAPAPAGAFPLQPERTLPWASAMPRAKLRPIPRPSRSQSHHLG